MRSVLFVCTGNRARSPIAAACFRKELADRGLGADWRVGSAGTWAAEGLPATPDAVKAGTGLGLDLSEHRSAPITREALDAANLIVVMEQGQKEALESEFPETAKKLRLLSELATGVPYSLPDPALQREGSTVYGEIAELIRAGFDRLRELAADS